jgi:hypothetical protein
MERLIKKSIISLVILIVFVVWCFLKCKRLDVPQQPVEQTQQIPQIVYCTPTIERTSLKKVKFEEQHQAEFSSDDSDHGVKILR